MAEFAKKHHDEVREMQKNVEAWHTYFEKNIKRYHDFMRFVFSSSLTNDEKTKLSALKKPPLQFNILESYISRLRGEFSNYEPELMIRAGDNVPLADIDDKFLATIEVIEGHIREIFFNASTHSFGNPVYNDTMSGGFSVAKAYTDYLNEMSFEQSIIVEKAFDPTLCGFDPMAREPHKGDGGYCFEIVPRTKEEFEQEFGRKVPVTANFTRSPGGFSWSYMNQNQKILLVVDYYKKVMKREKISKLSNGRTIMTKHYDDLMKIWNDAGMIEQPPVIVETRTTNIEEIWRYRFCQDTLLDCVKTDYKYLPFIFIDGNSVMIQDSENSPVYQMTRPYVYHAKDIQKLKNFAGQTVASEIETMVQHKWKAALESIPKEYLDAFLNPQQAQTLVYNAFYNKDPNMPLPAPQEVQRTPTPPIVESVFMGSDQVTQAILGSYDAQMGIVDGSISGKAIQQGALHSNAASRPYLINYTNGLNRIAQILVDLIPKYYATPRSLPIRKMDGRRSYVLVNDAGNPDSISLKYDPNSLNIKVEAGVNTAVQKQIALEQIIRLMNASETFAQFINSEGLETLLDNIDIRGVEQLKINALKFMDGMKQQAAAAAQQPDPMQQAVQAQVDVEMAKIQQRQLQAEGELSVKAAQVSVEKQKADTDFLKLMVETENEAVKDAIEQEKVNAENAKDAVRFAIEMGKEVRSNNETIEEKVDMSGI